MNIMEFPNVQYTYDNKANRTGEDVRNPRPLRVRETNAALSLPGGLNRPSGGQIFCQEEDIARTSLADHRRSHVAFAFQNYNLVDCLTPMANATLTAKLPPLPILEQPGLTTEEAKRNVTKLSVCHRCAGHFGRRAGRKPGRGHRR